MGTKPGWQTTEFWVTIAVNVVAVLAMLGVFAQNDVHGIENAVEQIGAGVTAVVANFGYIWSRARVKQAANGN